MAAKVRGLQQWCKRQCEGYRDVSITNMTSSWKSGLAFCAIIHRYRPDLINYDALSKDDVFGNNKLAFDIASEHLGIPTLLDPDDMLTMSVPDKLCIVTYASQYYNYFHDKTPGLVSEVSTQHPNQADRPNPFGVHDSQKGNVNASNGQPILLPADDVFLRDMSANVAHRRGSVVDDTCYRCGKRVYLLERHLASSGQLFHRHCYRDSERTATLQRANSRRTPSYQKENLLLPSNPEVVSTGRRCRRKSSTTAATNIESVALTTAGERCAAAVAQGKGGHPVSIKLPEVEMPRVVEMVKSSEVTERKVPALITATHLSTPTACFGSAAKSPKSTDNGTARVVQKSLAQTAKRLSTPGMIASGTACYPVRLTPEDRKTKVAKPRITAAGVDDRAYVSSANGSTSTTDQSTADGSKYTSRSSGPTVPPLSDQHRETSTPALLDRARPALSTTGQPTISATRTSSVAVVTGVTANVSLPSTSLSSADRSCDVIPGTEPARVILRHLTPIFSAADEKQITVTTNCGQKSKDCSASAVRETSRLKSPSCSVNDRISTTPTAFQSFSDRDSLSDVSVSPSSACLVPVSLNSGLNSTRLNTVMEHRSSELQIYRGDSSAEKQNFLSPKIHHLYRPKSLENLLEPVHSRQVHKTTQILHDSCTTDGDTIFEPTTSPLDDAVHAGWLGLKDRKIGRPKSTCDLFGTTSNSRDNERKPHEVRRNFVKFRNEPVVKGLLDNLTKVRQRKQQESNLARGEETALKRQDSRPAVTARSEKFPQETAAKYNRTSPVTSHPVAPRSPSIASLQVSSDRTSKRNEDTSLTSPLASPHRTTLKVDDEPAEFVGRKKYFAKCQADLLHGRETGLRQMNVHCSEQESQSPQPRSSQSSARKSVAPVGNDPPSLAVTNQSLSGKFSKSVDDLSQVLRPATGKVEKRCREQMTDWQLEVERRREARGGHYIDPEKLSRSQRHNTPASIKADTPKNVPKSTFELNKTVTSGTTDSGHQRVSSLCRSKKKSNMSASVDNLATCHLIQDISRSSLRPGLISPELDEDRSQAIVGASSDAESINSPTEVQPSSCRSVVTRTPMSRTPPYSLTEDYYESLDSPVAELHNTSQNSNAGASILDAKILRRLDELDAALRELELDGRLLEERIRSETDEAMDDRTDEMMVEWFGLVRKRNEFLREESSLIYAWHQQELEILHRELQNQLQGLMCKPDKLKSRADWQLETSLLRELVDTVTQRSTIVDSMETDRLRYQEEDKELEEMIAASGVPVHKGSSGCSGWSRRNSIRKMKTRSDMDVAQAGNLTKFKKKKFSIFSLARKSLTPKKGVRAAGSVPVTAH